MYTLAPSVFAADSANLDSQMAVLEESGVTCLHVDIMDGRFVPLKAFGAETVSELKRDTNCKIDVHLMTEHPEQKIVKYAEAGADVLTVHFEACEDPVRILKAIRLAGMEAGLALEPSTMISDLREEIWNEMDVLQIMTVRPGRLNQHFIPGMLGKIEDARHAVRASGKEILIEVDGDITRERLKPVLNAGASIVVVGKAVFQGDIRQNVREYMDLGN